MTPDRREHRLPLLRLLAVLFTAAVVVSGCALPMERKALLGGRESTIDNVQGPTERRLRDLIVRRDQAADDLSVNGSLKPIAGTEAYLAAEELFEQEQYAAAEKAFKGVAKKYKKSEIREDALFMQAESAFNLGHYSDAEMKYTELLKFYPSTRHLDDVSKRLFEIARVWLDFPEAAALGEVQQVNYDDFRRKLPAEESTKKSRGPMFWPNFTDKARPLFDPEGNGVAALRLIWLNDPTGPLADDALMLAASHYARKGDFIEADRHYTLLREEYPNSPHVQQAFVLGSHVKLMAYQGPNYDGKSLQDAEHLKKSTLRLYPNLEEKERIERELARIEEAKAAREWEQVIFYERKNNPRAQAVYCHLILQRYPDTSAARQAEIRLKQLGPEYASGGKLLTAQPDPPPYQSAFGRLPAKPPPPSRPPGDDEPRRTLNPFGRSRDAAEPGPTPDDPDAQPIEKPATPEPRRSPFRRSEPEPNAAPPYPAEPSLEAGYSEDKPAEQPGGWSRMFRFTPPRLLRPNSDAKPVADPVKDEDDTEEATGESRL
jgi:outer membrane protein assembly factor BamD (BamD/ComL family)